MYKVGDEVSYGLHGKCIITAIETKELPSGPISFYQIRMIKNPIIAKSLARKQAGRKEPSILVPVDSAQNKGLRPLMTKVDAEKVLEILADPGTNFEINDNWVSKQKQLEEIIRKEGAIGLAKVVGHLYMMIQEDAVPPSNIMKFYESVLRIFTREFSDSLGITSKEAEPMIAKALRTRLHSD